MNKRGFLLAEETLKIVLAVICLVFLIYLLTSLYFKHQEDKDLELAKASLEHLVSEINAGAKEVEIYNPEDWWISSWPYEGVKPKGCVSNCVCVCESKFVLVKEKKTWLQSLISTHQEYADYCWSNGLCSEVSKKIILENAQRYIEIKPVPLKLNMQYSGSDVTLSR